jgi:hypothetical protein
MAPSGVNKFGPMQTDCKRGPLAIGSPYPPNPADLSNQSVFKMPGAALANGLHSLTTADYKRDKHREF